MTNNEPFDLEPTILPALFNDDASESNDESSDESSELGYETPREEIQNDIILENNADLMLDAYNRAATDDAKDAILKSLGNELKNNAEFFKRNKISLQYAGPQVFDNLEFIWETLFNAPDEYNYLPATLQKDERVIDRMLFLIAKVSMEKTILKLCEQILILHTEKLSFENIEAYHQRLRFLCNFFDDIQFSQNFLTFYVHCYPMLPLKYQYDLNISLMAFSIDQSIYNYLPKNVLESKDFVIEALKINGDVSKSDLIKYLGWNDILDLLDNKKIELNDILEIKFDDNSPHPLEEYSELLIGLFIRYQNQADFKALLEQLKPFIQDNRTALYHLIKINPSYCEFASERLRNEPRFMSLAIYSNMECLDFVGEQLAQDKIFQNTAYQMTNNYMLELIAKTTLSLGLAAFGFIMLTQMVSIPFILLAAASVVTGLCASGFFANKVFQFNQLQNFYQNGLNNFKI